jgi:hypothetical protein
MDCGLGAALDAVEAALERVAGAGRKVEGGFFVMLTNVEADTPKRELSVDLLRDELKLTEAL